jgi:hypothetical protein
MLVAMNTTGLLWARDKIPDAGGMIVQNIAFAVFVWSNALESEANK